MGVMDRFERRLDRLVSGTFARAFKSEVQPVEVAAALQRECDDRAAIVTRGRTMVPNEFMVELGQHDYERLSMYAEPLGAELAAMVREHADEQGYQFVGAGDGRVRAGRGPRHRRLPGPQPGGRRRRRQPRVRRASRPPPRCRRRWRPGSSTLALTHRHTVLGRGADADLRLDDPSVSRRHAEIVLSDPPRVNDLGSTNGTFLDGERVQSAELYDGARVGIGSLTMVFRYGG